MPNLEEWWKLPAFAPVFQGSSGGSKYGYTGNGADNAIQPGRRVPGVGNPATDKHEGEFIFDANATQAIGPDVLEAIRQGATSGQVDSNTLREAIGQPTKQGFQQGGFDTGGVPTDWKPADYDAKKANPTGNASANQDMADYFTNRMNTYDTEAIGSPTINQANRAAGAQQRGANASQAMADYYTRKINEQDPERFGAPTQEMVAISEKGRAQMPTPEPTTEAISQPDYRADAMKYLADLMTGKNTQYEAIANKYLQDIGGAGAAAYAGLKSELARRGMSPQAIATALQSIRRDTSSDIARAAGEMAIGARGEMTDAARTLAQEGKWDIERADKEEEKSRQDFLGYVSTKLMTDPNYDWTTDQAAVNLAEGAWGADYKNLATGAAEGLKTSKSTATINALKADPKGFYATAPSGGAGVYKTADGQLTKEFWDEVAFPAMAMQLNFPGVEIGLDDEGNFIWNDTTTGESVTGGTTTGAGEIDVDTEYQNFDLQYTGDDLNVTAFNQFINEYGRAPKDEDEWVNWSAGTGRTYGTVDSKGNVTVTAKNASSATYVFTDKYDMPDVTTGAMQQYLEEHGGKLPSRQEWNDWSKSERTYDAESGDDVAAAQVRLNKDVPDTVMSEYLKANDGKIGDSKTFDAWMKDRTYGTSDDEIEMAITQLNDPDVSYARMTQYINAHKGKIGTRSEFDKWNSATPDPEAIQTKLTADTSVPDGQFGVQSGMTLQTPIDYKDMKVALDSGMFENYKMTTDLNTKMTGAQAKQLAQGNVGKAFEVDGKWYVLTAVHDTMAEGTGGSKGFFFMSLDDGTKYEMKIPDNDPGINLVTQIRGITK